MPAGAAEGARRVIVVSGLPRSGTSLMMQMLAAGGLPILTDGLRAPDTSNPNGYLEYEPVKRLKDGEAEWLAKAQGKAVKVVSSLLAYLPAANLYDVIFMLRPLPEVVASQRKMLIDRGRDPGRTSDAEMARLYEQHLEKTKTWLAGQRNMRTLHVEYASLLAAPAEPMAAVARFLETPLNQAAMCDQVDASLYRNRVSK